MKRIQFFYILILLLLLQACSGVMVSQDYDQSYNFSKLKTFAWKPNKDNEYGFSKNPLIDKRLRTSIVNSFSEKQFSQLSTGAPDFFISYYVTIERKISNTRASGGITLGRSSRGRYGSVGISTGSQISAYDQGTLLIDVTDTANNNLIWRGISTQAVSEHSDPNKSTKRIDETVKKMLGQFPPGGNK